MMRNNDIPNDVIKRHDELKGDRGTWENHWEEVAAVCLPR